MDRKLLAFSFLFELACTTHSIAAETPKSFPGMSTNTLRGGVSAKDRTDSVIPGTKQEVDPGVVVPSSPPLPPISPKGKGVDEIEVDPEDLLGKRSLPRLGQGFESGSIRAQSSLSSQLLTAEKLKPPRPPPVEVDPNDVLGRSVNPIGRGFEATPIEQAPSDTCMSEKMPFHLLRSIVFFIQSKDGMACSAAVKSIRSLKNTYGPDAYETLKNPSYLASADHALARRIVEDYVGSCSKGLSEGSVSRLLTLDNQIRAAKNIGIITTPTQRCMGSIVNSRVLTARHCFAKFEADAGAHDLIPIDSAIEFSTLSGESTSLSFDGSDRSPLREDQRDKDWITLAMKAPITEVPSTSLGYDPDLALLWQPLVLISMSPYVMALQNNFKSSTSTAVIDISPVCDILAKDGNYVFHACQTLAGMSGAPLLTMKDGLLTVVGVHTGDTNSVQTKCAQNVGGRYVNYGVVPPADLGGAK